MHQIYSTEGLVCGKRPVGEANTLLFILTRELGLVRATARSTRVAHSKLRYGLEPLMAARYSFVKGRHEWRLVQVDEPVHLFAQANPAQRAAAGRIAHLMMRLIQGAEPNAQLFADVSDGFRLLCGAERPEAIEVVLVLRILSHLGYLPHSEALAPYVDGSFTVDLSAQALAERSLLVRTINESLKATGL